MHVFAFRTTLPRCSLFAPSETRCMCARAEYSNRIRLLRACHSPLTSCFKYLQSMRKVHESLTSLLPPRRPAVLFYVSFILFRSSIRSSRSLSPSALSSLSLSFLISPSFLERSTIYIFNLFLSLPLLSTPSRGRRSLSRSPAHLSDSRHFPSCSLPCFISSSPPQPPSFPRRSLESATRLRKSRRLRQGRISLREMCATISRNNPPLPPSEVSAVSVPRTFAPVNPEDFSGFDVDHKIVKSIYLLSARE